MPIRTGRMVTSTFSGISGSTPEWKRIKFPLPEISPSGNRHIVSPRLSRCLTLSKNICISLGCLALGTRVTPRYQKMKRIGQKSTRSARTMKRSRLWQMHCSISKSSIDTWFDTSSTGPELGMCSAP